MYTLEKFIKFPIKIYNEEESAITGSQQKFSSYEMVNPFCIARYRPTWDEDDADCVCVSFKDGTNILVYMTINEFESILNNYFK